MPRKSTLTIEETTQLSRQLQDGVPMHVLSGVFGLSISRLYALKKGFEEEEALKLAESLADHEPKLAAEDIEDVTGNYLYDETIEDLAKRFEVSEQTIKKITDKECPDGQTQFNACTAKLAEKGIVIDRLPADEARSFMSGARLDRMKREEPKNFARRIAEYQAMSDEDIIEVCFIYQRGIAYRDATFDYLEA